MPDKPSPALILRFACHHYYTEGKFDNTVQAAEQIGADRICLSLTNGPLDDSPLDKSEITERLTRVKTVIAKFKYRGIKADLVLPSLTDTNKSTTTALLKFLYSNAAQTKARTLWIDDAAACHHHRFNRTHLISWFSAIRRAVHKTDPRIRLGLIAALPETYTRLNTTPAELARVLAGDHQPLLALTQPFTQDYQRTDILHAAQTIAAATTATSATTASDDSDIEILGCLDHQHPSTYHKSVEATQMQINLNLLFGVKQMMLNCFDLTGTAPGNEDPFLNMHQNHHRVIQKLIQLLPDKPQHYGICVVTPESPDTSDTSDTSDKTIDPERQNPWPALLWRLGLPVTFATPKTVTSRDSVFVLTGETPCLLKRKQLEHIFCHGVLLDAQAALALQEMNLAEMTGVKVGGSISGVQTEIFSDQSFAAPYYGQRIILTPHLQSRHFHRLSALNPAARPITILQQKNRRPDIHGTYMLDDEKNNSRCVVLPYSLEGVDTAFMLSPARQRLMQDIFRWLGRQRLAGFVESTADLAPFYIPLPGRRKIVMALLNVGFDWAIDARIRLGKMPFAIKRIRELNEHGQIVTHNDLKLTRNQDYHYIQLSSDTAVPPMQMTILLLEG